MNSIQQYLYRMVLVHDTYLSLDSTHYVMTSIDNIIPLKKIGINSPIDDATSDTLMVLSLLQ